MMILKPARCGEQHPLSKLRNPQADQIRQQYEQGGTSYRRLGREYGVSHTVVFRIVWEQSYRRGR